MDDVPIEALRRLLAIADAYHLRELVVEEDGLRVTIRTDSAHPAPAVAPPPPASETAYPADVEPEEVSEEEPGFHALRSPMTGIFYRSASPDSPAFVVEEQMVEEGQTVGLIEAMKV